MAKTRKAADLNSIIRLVRWTEDERRRALSTLLNREEQLELFGAELGRQMEREAAIAAADPTDAGYTFGAFAADHRKRRERLADTLNALRGEIEEARERLALAYRERKVYEEVQGQRQDNERLEENRLEQIALDEIAQNQHRRRTRDAG